VTQPTDLDFTNLDDLAQMLTEAGVRSVSTDPAKVNTPGVWIKVDGIGDNLLAGVTIRTTLYLIVPDQDVRRALTALAAMYNTVYPVLRSVGGPTGPIRTTGLVLPNSQTPLPALAAPLDLLTTPNTEE
jgi:hypothetical protein